jgi:hypothetical protein
MEICIPAAELIAPGNSVLLARNFETTLYSPHETAEIRVEFPNECRRRHDAAISHGEVQFRDDHLPAAPLALMQQVVDNRRQSEKSV